MGIYADSDIEDQRTGLGEVAGGMFGTAESQKPPPVTRWGL